MNDVRNGKIYGALFIFLIVVLIVGGYFLTIHLTKDTDKESNNDKDKTTEVVEESDKLKKDKTKDYIYFLNSDSKSLEHEIVYQDVIFNINSNEAVNVANKLNNEMKPLKETFKKLSEVTLTEEEEEKVLYKEDDIYSATFRKYTRYFYKSYASLLSEEYDYDCFNGSTFKNSMSYVFDINTGELLTNSELLKIYNKNLDSIKSVVKEKLEKNQTLVDEVELINIAETLKNLENEDNYALYINKSGFLVISYLVKTTQVDYNDVIILN